MSWSISILGEKIPVSERVMPVADLFFLKDNPRVYAVTHGSFEGFSECPVEQQQQIIFKKLSAEPSVQKLLPEVRRHGGLLEPILIRYDTKEVIEGNSRLAVYRLLQGEDAGGPWSCIPCLMISGLSDKQQAAFLNQIHVKGKTSWSAYEKANFAFVRKKQGWKVGDIAELFGESVGTIRTRVNIVRLMKDSGDDDQRRFSYYDVLVRTPEIWKGVREPDSELRRVLVQKIRRIDSDAEQEFTAQELRRRLPAVMRKPKVLRRYLNDDCDLDEAFQRAKVSRVEQRVKHALAQLEGVERDDVTGLDQNSLNALNQAVRKLEREIRRVRGLVDKRKNRA